MRRVATAAGDEGYQAALSLLLAGEPDLQHVGSATDVTSLLALITAHDVDVVAVDLRLPGGGLAELNAALTNARRHCGLVALALLDTPSARAAASRAGATFAEKADAAGLLAALREVPG